jgi:hypothetical protein
MRSGKTITELFDSYPTYSDILLRGYDPEYIDSYEVTDDCDISILPF